MKPPADTKRLLRDAGLGDKEADVYWAREIEGMGRQEAANALGYESASTVDSNHQNAKRKMRETAEAIRSLDPDENRVRTVEEFWERMQIDHPERAGWVRKLITARDEKKALRLEQPGNAHTIIFLAEDGSVAIGNKTAEMWSAHAYADFWTASKVLQTEFVAVDDAELVDVEDTRLFAAGQFQIQHTVDSRK